MYRNYGDKNFFDYGVLVDDEHSDDEFQIIRCRPYDDIEDTYAFAELTVNINDSWIDKKAVMRYIGMTEETFDKVQFAIGCTDYYAWENFGIDYYQEYEYSKESICNILKNRLIANDNLDIEW